MSSIYHFPSDLEPNSEKEKIEFGQKVADAIYNEWFSNKSKYTKRANWFEEMRKFSSGDHDMDFFKKWLCGDDKKWGKYMDYMNVDFENRLQTFPKYCDILKNNIASENFDIHAFSIDPTHVEEKNKKLQLEKGKQILKDVLKENEKLTGVKVVDDDVDYISDEEMEIDNFLNKREKIEKAEEILIQGIFAENRHNEIKKRNIDDLVEVGIACKEVRIDPQFGVRIKYIEPDFFVHSPTNDPYFRDCKYKGVIRDTTIGEVNRISDIKLDEKDIKSLVNSYDIKNNDQNTVRLISFCYKTHHSDEYKYTENKQKALKILRYKRNGVNEPKTEDAQYKKISDNYDVWYECTAVIFQNTNNCKVVSWKQVENTIKVQNEYICPYVAIAPNIKLHKYNSIVSRALSIFKDMQRLDLKIQHLSNELRPTEINIPTSMMKGIEIAEGQTLEFDELLAMKEFKGINVYEDTDDEGNYKQPNLLRETAPTQNGNLERSVSLYQFKKQELKEALGINDYTDASSPHPDTLVGVMEIARLNSNMATRHILDASIYLTECTAESTSCALDNIFQFSKELKEKYINMVGKDDVTVIESMNKRGIASFGIQIDYVPTHTELMNFEKDLQLAVQEGSIDLYTRTKLRRLKNLRLAEMILKVEREKQIKKLTEMKDQDAQRQINVNAQSSQIANQARQETEMLVFQNKTKTMEMETYYYIQKKEVDTKAKLMIDKQDFEGRLQLATISKQQDNDKIVYKEDREDQRRMMSIHEKAVKDSELNDQKRYGILPSFRKYPDTNIPNNLNINFNSNTNETPIQETQSDQQQSQQQQQYQQ